VAYDNPTKEGTAKSTKEIHERSELKRTDWQIGPFIIYA